MIEIVAKAIWETTHPNPPGWSAWGDREGFGPNVQEREWTLKQALAAIKALREPTEAMVIAAARDWGIGGGDQAKWCWRAMIDAALAAP